MSGLHRPERILRALAGSRLPLSCTEIVEQGGEGVEFYQVQGQYSRILRDMEFWALVADAGQTPGGYRRGPRRLFRITPVGRRALAAYAAGKVGYAERCALSEAQRTERTAEKRTGFKLLADAAASYGPGTPRADRIKVARDLRDAGVRVSDICALFGLSRQMISRDLRIGDGRGKREDADPAILRLFGCPAADDPYPYTAGRP